MEKKLAAALNEQINHELFSAYLYLSMAAWSETRNLPGFAHWLSLQAKEEVGHAMKIFGFLVDRGERVVLDAIKKPETDFESPRDVFARTLEHEKKVTALINRLYDLSGKVNDQAAAIFLQWFVTEQVEEEKNASSILETLKMLKPDSSAIFMLDHQLAKRE
ncbi:MAG: Ferritin [candidate division TA06 bacterium ADurb.Bin417]|uniref:Ferritin n=1 Tax=candidate division TA06 bacterium ADurb.Bin417 TaxID=1852828 RepID=A0A1V5MCI0_UNCT6|nr:MAG: Ferritin [candidate division TA06 bacterium ADurb.Bin417]